MEQSEAKGSEGLAARVVPLLLAAAAIIAVWQAVVLIFKPHVSLLPPPWLAAAEFWTLLISGELFVHTGISLARVFSAGLIARGGAVPFGPGVGGARRASPRGVPPLD